MHGEKIRARLIGRVGDNTAQPGGAGFNSDAIVLQKQRLSGARVHRSNLGLAFEHQQPCLRGNREIPARGRGKIDPFKNKIRAGNEQSSDISETPDGNLSFRRFRAGNRYRVGYMKLPLSAIIKHAKGGIAVLLNFGDNDSRTDRMDRAGGNKNDIARLDMVPLHLVGNRAVLDRRLQLLSCERLNEANRHRGIRCRGKNIPCLGLSVRQADGSGKAVIRMNLNGELFVSEKQFKQQGRVRSIRTCALKP